MSVLSAIRSGTQSLQTYVVSGTVVESVGLSLEAEGLSAPVGALALLESGEQAEVVGFRDERAILMLLDESRGIKPGAKIHLLENSPCFRVGDSLLGRIVDPLGKPMDSKPVPSDLQDWPLFSKPPEALSRPPIRAALTTGVRAIDGLFTCGRGQRIGLFAGSGVGKSSLMGMITRYSDADIIVVCLVGERGREVREFIENDLGEEGMKRAVVVCATSDRPPLQRVRAAAAAHSTAEYFRAQGKHVVLLVDSVTRLALAQREIGLSTGEPPTTRGYPPSVFTMMPKLLERAGATDSGSITAFYTVLVEGDDTNEPVADTLRGILDGHIWLDRNLANKGHYPAIRIDDSISRLASSVCSDEHLDLARQVRQVVASYNQNEDLISIGAYQRGSNPEIDDAIGRMPAVREFLQQKQTEHVSLDETIQHLREAMKGKADGGKSRPLGLPQRRNVPKILQPGQQRVKRPVPGSPTPAAGGPVPNPASDNGAGA